MNINELDNYDLKDAIRFHSRLNPGLWNNREHIKPEVREALLKIADDFREFLGVPDLQVKDITISGSNAAYTYTPHSDIDLHLVVEIPELYDPVYRELFNAKKFQYNEQHSIKVRNTDVELYVQPSDEPVISQGEYSLKKNFFDPSKSSPPNNFMIKLYMRMSHFDSSQTKDDNRDSE